LTSLPLDPRFAYGPGSPVEDGPRAAKHRLVREVKRIVEAAALLDLDGTTRDQVEELANAAGAVADQLAPRPSLVRRGGLAMAGGDDSALAERSGISGKSNPLAPPLHLEFHENGISAWAVYTDSYEGPPGCLHGGFVAAAFDDLMGLVQLTSGNAGYTGTLTVRMVKPTPLHRRIDYEASVDHIDGRKIWVRGHSSAEGELLGEAEILFIAPKQGFFTR
jgi:acyl-coenzyme A thioesterase PaaI-like protein